MITHRIACKLVDMYAYALILATALALVMKLSLRQYIILVGIFYVIDRFICLLTDMSITVVILLSLVMSLIIAVIAVHLGVTSTSLMLYILFTLLCSIWLQTLIMQVRSGYRYLN